FVMAMAPFLIPCQTSSKKSSKADDSPPASRSALGPAVEAIPACIAWVIAPAAVWGSIAGLGPCTPGKRGGPAGCPVVVAPTRVAAPNGGRSFRVVVPEARYACTGPAGATGGGAGRFVAAKERAGICRLVARLARVIRPKASVVRSTA